MRGINPWEATAPTEPSHVKSSEGTTPGRGFRALGRARLLRTKGAKAQLCGRLHRGGCANGDESCNGRCRCQNSIRTPLEELSRRAGGRPDGVAHRERRGSKVVGVVLQQTRNVLRSIWIPRRQDIRLYEGINRRIRGGRATSGLNRQLDGLRVAQSGTQLGLEGGLGHRCR